MVISTYLEQQAVEAQPESVEALREATVAACLWRIRPCLMTTATTLLALLPVLTSQGRGRRHGAHGAAGVRRDGVRALTLFVVPVGWCAVEELKLRVRQRIAAG
ncbi:MAG: efflux RND transporter permease subunit [bacterium]